MEPILIVDDEAPIRRLMGQILAAKGYACHLAGDAAEARAFLQEKTVSLVIADINMPGESGLDFMRYALATFPETAGIMATGLDDQIVAEAALEIGVYDYLVKPIERNSLLISTANALRRRELEISSRNYRRELEETVAQRTASLHQSMKKLRLALNGIIRTVAHTIEIRDPYTAGHQQRVAQLAVAIARELGLPEETVEGVQMGGVIHDLGKISIPAEILSKPGRLTEIEFRLIQTHPQVGSEILSGVEFPWPVAQMVLQHHERMDGSGYPQGLAAGEILQEAKILAVSDVVEAMGSHRPYRPSLGIEKALEEIARNQGRFYDPDAAAACIRLITQKDFEFRE